MVRLFKIFTLFASLWISTSLSLQAGQLLDHSNSHSKLQVFSEYDAYAHGEQQWLALRFEPKAGWHTYWKNYGDSGASPILNWEVPAGISIGEPRYPAPEIIRVGSFANYGYSSASVLLIPFDVDENYRAEKLPLKLSAEWLVCDIECIPQTGEWVFSLPVKATPTSVQSEKVKSLFSTARQALPEPSYWDSKLDIYNKNSVLYVYSNPSDLDEITSSYFFPESAGVLDHAAPQSWEWAEEGLKLSFSRMHASPEPTSAVGVLRLETIKGDVLHIQLNPGYQKKLNPEGSAPESSAKASVPHAMPLWQAVLFAFLGGIILNLMPCVFPVLSIKAMSLVRASTKSAASRQLEGWLYTLGIWVSFMIIVLLLVGLRTSGEMIGWGFQLQSPLFVGFLALVMVLMALSLFGFFNVQTGFESAGHQLTTSSDRKGAFFTGFLATLVATPCTAPLMAPAIGFALTQPLLQLAIIFSMLAVGLAAPFLILSYMPNAARFMPKPGPWMEKLKQALGFPMLLTACWLVYVFGLQAGDQAAFGLLVVLTVISFCAWLWKATSGYIARAVMALLAFTALAGLYMVASRPPQPAAQTNSAAGGPHIAFTQETLDEALSNKQAVFVYFTAEWCITCKVNEQVALRTDIVERAFQQHNITVLKADWTNRNSEIASILASYGRAGVPLYLYFPAGKTEAIILPEILTSGLVLEYLSQNTPKGA